MLFIVLLKQSIYNMFIYIYGVISSFFYSFDEELYFIAMMEGKCFYSFLLICVFYSNDAMSVFLP